MIKTIIFDNGGILVEDTWQTFLKNISKEMSVTLDDFNKMVYEPISKALIGRQTFKEFVKDLSVKTNNSKYLKDLLTIAKRNEDIIEVAIKLKGRYQLAMLTNDLGTFRNDDKSWHLEKIFGKNIYCSSEIGLRKPDAESFKFVLKELGIRPEETIFIDDKEKNVKVSESLGIKGIVFKNKRQFIQDLNLYGVNV